MREPLIGAADRSGWSGGARRCAADRCHRVTGEFAATGVDSGQPDLPVARPPGTAESGKGEAKPFLGCGMGEAITGMGSRLPDALCFQFLFLKPILTITRLKNTTMTMKAFFTCGMGEKFWHGTEAPK